MEEIKTDLKKLILSHQSLSQLQRQRKEYIANQLVTVFCKGKNLKTALREIHQSCGERTRIIAGKVTEDLALHLARVAAIPDEP